MRTGSVCLALSKDHCFLWVFGGATSYPNNSHLNIALSHVVWRKITSIGCLAPSTLEPGAPATDRLLRVHPNVLKSLLVRLGVGLAADG